MIASLPMLYYGRKRGLIVRVANEIVLTDEERGELTGLVRSKLTSVRLAQRAHIVLLAADGLQNKDIAARLAVGRASLALA
jgi:hypothetical protein